MFPAVCSEVAKEVGRKTLIPSPGIDESRKLKTQHIVIMRKKKFLKLLYRGKTYSPCNIELLDILNDHSVLEVETERWECCTLNHREGNRSMNVKIKGKILCFRCSLAKKDEFTVNIGQLYGEEISYGSFKSALQGRSLDMTHSIMEEITDTNAVLCVVTCVIKSTDTVEIKRKSKKNASMKLSKKVTKVVNVDLRIAHENGKDMLINPNTTLAYKVRPLNVDVNSKEIIRVMTVEQNEVRPIGDIHLKQYTWTCHPHKKKDFHPSMARPMR